MTDNPALRPFLCQLICCPDCRGALYDTSARRDSPLGLSNKDRSKDLSLHCEGCQASFPVEEGVPLLFSKKIQQETAYKIFYKEYDEREQKLPEIYHPIANYLQMDSMERLKYHLLNGFSSLRLRRSASKVRRRLMSLARFIGPTAGLTILDVGAREGLLLSLLKGNKVAFDVMPMSLRYGQERGNSGVAGFGERLPFKDNSFDVVVCSQVLEHVLQAEAAAAEMTRVLKPAGRVIIETPFGEAEEDLFEVQGDSGKIVSRGTLQRAPTRKDRKERPPSFHVRSFKDEKDLELLFPSLKVRKREFCFYKRRRDVPWWVKKLLGPIRRLPDSLKTSFPSLFAPMIVRMEFVSGGG